MKQILDKFIPYGCVIISAAYMLGSSGDPIYLPLALLSSIGWISYIELRDRQGAATIAD